MQITFNNQTYTATYNEQTGYWETELDAVSGNGGLYTMTISGNTFSTYTYKFNILKRQISADFKSNSWFIWVFDKRDATIKEILEVFDYDITIDEETNANSTFTLMKDSVNIDSGDLLVFNNNGTIEYYGVIEEIQSQGTEIKKTLVCRYITNIFDTTIPLQNGYTDAFYDGMLYRIDTGTKALAPYQDATTSGSEVRPANISSAKNTRWIAEDLGGTGFKLKNADNGLYLGYGDSNTILRQMSWDSMYQDPNFDTAHNGLWQMEYLGNNECYLTTYNYYNNTKYTISASLDGNGAMVLTSTLTDHMIFKVYQNASETMKYIGVEQQIKNAIESNFTKANDEYYIYPRIEVTCLSNTPKEISVTNVDNGIYNLHTWMNNVTQLYNIVYKWEFLSGFIYLNIKYEEPSSQLIDTDAQSIKDYEEVFETEIIGKVIVLTSTNSYTLYLKTDRTTTTDATSEDLAYGKVLSVYTENYDDAPQTALDQFKSNSYNHNISFRFNEYIPVGTPIVIKTQNQLLLDTYISSIKITPKNFYEYQCGNIRIKFIDKLLKERNK